MGNPQVLLGDCTFANEPKKRIIVAIDGLDKQGKCLDGEALVTRRDGKRLRVRDVKAGDRLLGLTETGNPMEVTVAAAKCDGIRDVRLLTLHDGREVRATAEHKFLTPRGWIRAEQLTPSDYVLAARHVCTYDGASFPKQTPRFLGFLLADGGLSTSSLTFTKNEPRVREAFIGAAHSLGFATYEKTDPGKATVVGVSGVPKGNHSPLKTFRDEWNLRGVAADKALPAADFFEWSLEMHAQFLEAYMECDGWITQTKTGLELGYCSASKTLAEQIAHLLRRFGINGRLRVRMVNDVPYWTWSGQTHAACVFVRAVGFIAGSAKSTRARGYVEALKPTRKTYAARGPKTPLDPAGMWVKVASNVKTIAVPVYDIDVSPAHTFLVNDILTHNTHFALTAPKPIVFMDFDIGSEGVTGIQAQGVIRTKPFMFRPSEVLFASAVTDEREQQKLLMEAAAPVLERFHGTYLKALREPVMLDGKGKKQMARTVIVDTGSEAWELLRLAELGKVTQVKPHHYVAVNGMMRDIVRAGYDSDVNVIWLHKLKAEWKDSAEGKGRKTGTVERQGFGDMAFLVQANLLAYRTPRPGSPNQTWKWKSGEGVFEFEAPARVNEGEEGYDPADLGFRLIIGNSRHNPGLEGMVFSGDMLNFPMLAQLLMPDSTEQDWADAV